MVEQPGQIEAAERRQSLAAVFGHEGILAACARDDRLMQMPSGGEHIRQFRAAHEGRVITVPMADLLHGAAEQHHGVGGLKPHVGWNVNSHWLGPNSTSIDRSGRPSARMSRLTISSTGSIWS